MPVSGFGVQSALAAMGAIALVVTTISSKPKTKRIVGALEKTSDHTMVVTSRSQEKVTVFVPESAPIFLNADRIAFDALQEGRTATVFYVKEKGRLVATELDVFPNLEDEVGPRKTSSSR